MAYRPPAPQGGHAAASWDGLTCAAIAAILLPMDGLAPHATDESDKGALNSDVIIFEALAQPTRLAALRLILAAGTAGLAAGDIARQLAVPHNSLSFHLSFLVRAGLAGVTKSGRQMIYRAETGNFHALIRRLAETGSCGVTEDPRTGAALIELGA